MHQPRPYGLHAIGLPLTDKDEAFIGSVAVRITNLKQVSGVDSLKMVYDLPDGGYVIVQDMGGSFRVISHKPIHGKDPIYDGVETDYIPMFFSGIVTKPSVHANEPVELKLTEQARFRLVNYSYLDKKPSKYIGLQRFKINYSLMFSEFLDATPSELLRTQYDQLRATWYSGAMAQVVQIVSGYGRQDFANLPDEKENSFERATPKLPSSVIKAINNELIGVRLPAYTGMPPEDGTIQYDYKFNHTNAVARDNNGYPWLVKVDRNGVWVMPLPIVPATRTLAFRRYIELVGDTEILEIINTFGAMPSGESFPTGENFEAWRRAGAIIKVCDTSDFYDHIAYSSACGWSFNESGSEGYNTCYDYYDDEGLGYGLTYKIRLNLASSLDYFGAEPIELVDRGPIADKVRLYLRQLLPTISSATAAGRAILYKLRRAKPEDIYQRALGRDGSKDKDYWHNLEMKPIADHRGNVSEVGRGYLYHGAKREDQPQIKFPEPLLGGCMSHDFLPLQNGIGKSAYPNSNTIMFAYFVGNTVKVIKYFAEWGKFFRKVESNYEKYMYVGEWQETETGGVTSIQGNFYTSDFDDLDFVAPSVTTTNIVGSDLGFDTVPFFEFDSKFASAGTLFRNRYFKRVTKSVTQSGNSIVVGVVIPYFCRNACLYANKESSQSEIITTGTSMGRVRDPTTYRFWTYDPIWAWYNNTITDPKGQPAPLHGEYVWVEEKNYYPSDGNNFADNGDWVGGMPADYRWLIHPDANEWLNAGGGGPPSVDENSSRTDPIRKEKGRVSIDAKGITSVISTDVPRPTYFTGSPSILGLVFRTYAAMIVFGTAEYGISSEKGLGRSRAYWGSTKLSDNQNTYCFIGVINE